MSRPCAWPYIPGPGWREAGCNRCGSDRLLSTPWFLESVADDGPRRTHPIRTLPFRVGREPAAELSINARGLSRRHAELRVDDSGALQLHDLDSTNGTWVNRERVHGMRVLAENDLIHFGNAAYRLGLAPGLHDPAQEPALRALLRGEGLSAALQPIVQAQGGQLHAQELLPRCSPPTPGGLDDEPEHWFGLARALGLECELAEAFRAHGAARSAPQLQGARLFVDARPCEVFTERFLSSLPGLRVGPVPPQLVVQVHGAAATQVPRLHELAARLATLGVQLAHGGFCADRAHLNALGAVPPHYVKFDSSLVCGLHEAPASHQKQLRDLVKLVTDLDAVPLAAGLTLDAEAALCRDMGFQLLQGPVIGAAVPVGLP